MGTRAKPFMRHKTNLAAKSIKTLLFSGAFLSFSNQASAFDNPLDCESGDLACRAVSVVFAGDFDRYISLMITDESGRAEAFRGNGIAIGNSAKAGEMIIGDNEGTHGVAIGADSQADGLSAVALGVNAQALGIGALSLGQETMSDGEEALALGNQSLASGLKAVAIGALASSEAERAVAIGPSSSAQAVGGVAIGSGSHVDSLSGFGLALGRNASVRDVGVNSVALGNESVSDRPNSVSVGAPGKFRQITNVADGVSDNDAVTVRQLKRAGRWAE